MKKLWTRWLALVVLVLLLGALFIRLGEWQLHRLEWRRGNNAAILAYEKQLPKPYDQVWTPGRTIAEHDQWQKVTVTGTYDATHQLQAMLRSTNDGTKKAGSEVLTPMRTTKGEWVLIDRGFLVRPQGTSEKPVLPDPPSGAVEVTGYVRRNEIGKPAATDPVDGAVRLVNSPAISATLPYKLVDGYVGVVSSKPAQTGDLLPMTTPQLTEGPHLSYAIQWFLFTAIAVTGTVILIRADLRDKKKAETKRAKKAERAAERAARIAAATAPRPEIHLAEPPAGHPGLRSTDPTPQED